MALPRYFRTCKRKRVTLSMVLVTTVYVLLMGLFPESTISIKPFSREVILSDKGKTEGAVPSNKSFQQETTTTKTRKIEGAVPLNYSLPRETTTTPTVTQRTEGVVLMNNSLSLETTPTITLNQTDVKRYSDYCNDTLLQPQHMNMKRISSYQFPGTEKYIKELFPTDMSPEIPDVPLFITGFSANHFNEGLALIDNFDTFIKVRYPDFKLHVYDVGITAEQTKEVKLKCNCTVESFPLEQFPEHDRILRGYGWKPLLMQFAARKYRFVIWMDACIRFKQSNIDDLLTKIRTHGIVTAKGGVGSIATCTLKETFDILNEQPCLYSGPQVIVTNFVAIRETDVVRDYIMKPWVSCALIRGCLVSSEDVLKVHPCKRPDIYHNCHRFDQSVLGILIHRLNHANIEDNVLQHNQYFSCCRNCI